MPKKWRPSERAIRSTVRGFPGVRFNFADRQAQQLADYVVLIEKWNRSINLVSRQDTDRLISRHVLDSLSGHLLKGKVVVDVGTGAGFPGVPLAIVNPERAFTLCDRMAKRVRFLRVVKSQLQLSNVKLVEQDLAQAKSWSTPAEQFLREPCRQYPRPLLEPGLAMDGRVLVFSSTQAPEAKITEQGDEACSPYRCRPETSPYLG